MAGRRGSDGCHPNHGKPSSQRRQLISASLKSECLPHRPPTSRNAILRLSRAHPRLSSCPSFALPRWLAQRYVSRPPTRTRSHVRVCQARFYSTEAPAAKKSAVSKYLLPIGGAVGGWLFYEYYFKGEPEQVKPKMAFTSPLDPQNFVDLKLKRVEPYNHNTSK